MSTFAVVDDNTTNRRILHELARSIQPDAEVKAFGCPIEALDWLTARDVNLVVTDFRMPGMNGDELIQRFRELPGRESVPVIVVTSFEDKELRYRALDAGATDFLLNPIDHREFRSRAANLLELHRLKQIVDQRAESLELQLKRVIDTVPAMISASDGDGRLLFLNRYFADFLALDPDEAAGRCLTDVLGQETGTRHQMADRAILRGNRPGARFDELLADAENTKHDLLTIKAPLQEDNGCIETVVTVSLDITDQKQQAAELAEQSVLMEAALSSMEQGICMTNPELDIVAVNRRLGELVPNAEQRYRLGVNLRDVIRTNAAKGVYGPGDPEVLANNQIEALESGRQLKFERLEPNGLHLETTGRPLPGGGYVATYTDITDRKRAEAALDRKTQLIALLNTVAMSANDATDVIEVMRVCVEEVCAFTEWPVGHVYGLCDEGAADLCSTGVWALADPERFETFRGISSEMRFTPGIGLPGRVLKTGKPAWIVDVSRDANFPRTRAVKDIGVTSGFAFPIPVGDRVFAVMEFFSPDRHEPDEELLTAMRTLGVQVGRRIERLHAELEVRALSRQKQLILDSVQEGIYGLDTDGRTTFANPAAAKMVGYEIDELVGKAQHAMIHHTRSDDTPYPREDCRIFAACKTGMASLVDDEIFWRKDGSAFPVEYASTPVVAEDGKVEGVVVTFRDISERKAAEEALRESEGRFRDFAESSSDWVWETDAQHRFTLVSERLCEITGVRSDYLTGKTPWETAGSAPESDPRWDDHRATMENKKPFRDVRCMTVDANGCTQHWKVSGKPILDDAGDFRGYRGTGTCESQAVEAQERAKHAESRLADALEVIPEGFSIYDAEDRLVLFNSKYKEMYGATGDAIVAGARFEDILRAGVERGQYIIEPGQEEKWLEQRLGKHRSQNQPLEQQLSDGRWLLIEECRTHDGGTAGVRADITQLKERERELSEKSTLLEVTLNSMAQGLVAFDADLTIVASNGSAADILALRPKFLRQGASFETVIRTMAERGDYGTGEPADYVAQHLEGIREGRAQLFELSLPDGRMLVLRGSPATGGGCVTTVTDVTERMQAETALRQQQSMFEVIFRDAPDALVMADATHAIIMANPAAATLFGYETEHMVGVAAASLYENNREYVREGHDAFYAERGEERDAHVARFQRKNGDVFSGELVSTVICGDDGDIFGYLSLIRDVTMRQEAEGRQRQGQKLEALGQMAGGIAHEFNNLLTSISGFTKMALKKPDDVGRVTDCLKEVVDASNRAADLTRQMLTFSHKQILAPKVVRMGSALGNTDKLIRAFIEESIDLKIEILDPDACIEVDPARLSQALVNLVNNARHAMPEGGALTLRANVVDIAEGFVSSHGDSLSPGPYARIDVIDSGTGIEPDVRARIFDPYFTTKEKGKGTGLGLSLVYGMVKNSKGVISVDSFMGAGTKFSIYLPVVDKLPCEGPEDEEVQQEILGGTETLLVAEDDNQLRTFVRTILEDAGFQVLTAMDGADALHIYDENADAIDLLVTDVIMPKMGGVDLVKALTAKRPDLKVVYMSGYAPELTEQMKEIGDEFCFLRKPFEPDALSRMVREALNS